MAFKMFMGWDPADTLAYEVCAYTLKKYASVPVEIIPLNERILRTRSPRMFWRPFNVDQFGQRFDGVDGKPCSTEFSFTRFLVAALADYTDEWIGFMDADMLFRQDIAELVDLIEDDKAVMCVKHNHQPPEKVKMLGAFQTIYDRKNWSSMFLMKPSANRELSIDFVNRATGSELHQFTWLRGEEIGSLPESWNWLCGWSSSEINPDIVHFTRGTPDMPGHENEPYADLWRVALEESGVRLAAFPQ